MGEALLLLGCGLFDGRRLPAVGALDSGVNFCVRAKTKMVANSVTFILASLSVWQLYNSGSKLIANASDHKLLFCVA